MDEEQQFGCGHHCACDSDDFEDEEDEEDALDELNVELDVLIALLEKKGVLAKGEFEAFFEEVLAKEEESVDE